MHCLTTSFDYRITWLCTDSFGGSFTSKRRSRRTLRRLSRRIRLSKASKKSRSVQPTQVLVFFFLIYHTQSQAISQLTKARSAQAAARNEVMKMEQIIKKTEKELESKVSTIFKSFLSFPTPSSPLSHFHFKPSVRISSQSRPRSPTQSEKSTKPRRLEKRSAER